MSESEGDPGSSSGKTSFEERLRSARGRRGSEKISAPGGRTGGFGQSPWGIGLRVGVELVAALVVAVGLGWALDRWLHTMPLFIVLGVLLGGAAGVLNVWRMFARSSAAPPGDKAHAAPSGRGERRGG